MNFSAMVDQILLFLEYCMIIAKSKTVLNRSISSSSVSKMII
jgi:hypothetical protein